MKRSLIPILCLLITGTTSCKKFLASYSQNRVFVQTATDLDELMIGQGYYKEQPDWFLFLMDDDVELGLPTGKTQFRFSGIHFWQPNPLIGSDGVSSLTDKFFNRIYLKIAGVNVVLHNIPLLQEKNEPSDTLRRLSGEAHFLRAYYYFMLVNAYGKPYQPGTATSDPGIPIKDNPEIEDKFFSRNTVKEVYDQVVKDLLDAEKELEGFNQSSIVRANQAAAQALLSRVYLYMEDYENAISYADKVIGNRNYQLFDLNKYVEGSEFATRSNPENIFTMGSSDIGAIMQILSDPSSGESYRASGDLVMNYSQQDLRLNAFFKQSSSGYLKVAKKRLARETVTSDVSDAWLLRFSELYLNKAEALAILGRDAEAISTLQELRKNRFKPEDLTGIAAAGQELVNFTRDERRREFCFESQRWFDLRRYAVNTKFPFSKTIRHIYYEYSDNGYYQNGYYELKPYEQDKATYIFPIPPEEIEFNNGFLTNEPRPERPLIQ